jgi:hypothetical protein
MDTYNTKIALTSQATHSNFIFERCFSTIKPDASGFEPYVSMMVPDGFEIDWQLCTSLPNLTLLHDKKPDGNNNRTLCEFDHQSGDGSGVDPIHIAFLEEGNGSGCGFGGLGDLGGREKTASSLPWICGFASVELYIE